MELVVQLLLTFVALSLLLQISHWDRWVRVLAAVIASIIAHALYPWVIEQSMDKIDAWLSSPSTMQNLAVVQVAEVLFFISIDFAMIQAYFGKKIKLYKKYAQFLPGIMWLAALLYLQMRTFYYFSQIDFDTLGLYFAAGVGIFIVLLPAALKWIIPEEHLRLELRYLIGFGQMLGAIIITIFCQVLPYQTQEMVLEMEPLIRVIGLAAIFFLLGWGWYVYRRSLR